MESFGLGYDALSAINPKTGLLLGVGVRPHRPSQGRRRLRGAHAGLQRHHVHHRRAGRPASPRAGVSFLDLTTGIFCAFGIVNALLHASQYRALASASMASLLETAVTPA